VERKVIACILVQAFVKRAIAFFARAADMVEMGM
jgi:hypothetical protein